MQVTVICPFCKGRMLREQSEPTEGIQCPHCKEMLGPLSTPDDVSEELPCDSPSDGDQPRSDQLVQETQQPDPQNTETEVRPARSELLGRNGWPMASIAWAIAGGTLLLLAVVLIVTTSWGSERRILLDDTQLRIGFEQLHRALAAATSFLGGLICLVISQLARLLRKL